MDRTWRSSADKEWSARLARSIALNVANNEHDMRRTPRHVQGCSSPPPLRWRQPRRWVKAGAVGTAGCSARLDGRTACSVGWKQRWDGSQQLGGLVASRSSRNIKIETASSPFQIETAGKQKWRQTPFPTPCNYNTTSHTPTNHNPQEHKTQ